MTTSLAATCIFVCYDNAVYLLTTGQQNIAKFLTSIHQNITKLSIGLRDVTSSFSNDCDTFYQLIYDTLLKIAIPVLAIFISN